MPIGLDFKKYLTESRRRIEERKKEIEFLKKVISEDENPPEEELAEK